MQNMNGGFISYIEIRVKYLIFEITKKIIRYYNNFEDMSSIL